mgnify:CR=1 FL=1
MRMRFKKGYLVFAAVLVLCAPLGIDAKKKISYDGMIRATAEGQEKIHITVGIVRNDSQSYAVYGKDGIEEMGSPSYEYEIGSITKTFTSSLLAKSLSERKIRLDDTIEQYLDIESRDYYPTILQLATHTSGYGQMNHAPMLLNAMKGRNPLMAFNREDMVRQVQRTRLSCDVHEWEYSNFGIAILGVALSESYGSTYPELMESYIRNDLKLQHTHVARGRGEIADYWEWNPDDVYIAAGGLVSNISDMMDYARIQMNEEKPYLSLAHRKHAPVDPKQFEDAAIDGMGLGWILDGSHGVIWHDGGTDNHNSYLGFSRDKRIAVVVLANTPDDFRYSARDIGANLLLSLMQRN